MNKQLIVNTRYGDIEVEHYGLTHMATILKFDNKEYVVDLLNNENDVDEIESIICNILKEEEEK